MSFTDILAIVITADSAKAEAAFKRVGASAETELNKANSQVSSLSSNLTKWGAGAVVAGGIVGAAMFKAAQAYADAATQTVKLDNSVKNNAATAGDSAAPYIALAQHIEDTTTARHADVQAGAAQLIQMGLTKDQIEKLLPVVVDFALKTGQDIPSAAKKAGLAVDGHATLLTRLGVVVNKADYATDHYRGTLDALTKGFGGFGAQLAGTPQGQLEQFKNKMVDLEQELGKGALPVLTGLAHGVETLVSGFEGLPGPVKETVGAVASVGAVGLVGVGVLGLVSGAILKVGAARTLLTGAKTAGASADAADADAAAADVTAQEALAAAYGDVIAARLTNTGLTWESTVGEGARAAASGMATFAGSTAAVVPILGLAAAAGYGLDRAMSAIMGDSGDTAKVMNELKSGLAGSSVEMDKLTARWKEWLSHAGAGNNRDIMVGRVKDDMKSALATIDQELQGGNLKGAVGDLEALQAAFRAAGGTDSEFVSIMGKEYDALKAIEAQQNKTSAAFKASIAPTSAAGIEAARLGGVLDQTSGKMVSAADRITQSWAAGFRVADTDASAFKTAVDGLDSSIQKYVDDQAAAAQADRALSAARRDVTNAEEQAATADQAVATARQNLTNITHGYALGTTEATAAINGYINATDQANSSRDSAAAAELRYQQVLADSHKMVGGKPVATALDVQTAYDAMVSAQHQATQAAQAATTAQQSQNDVLHGYASTSDQAKTATDQLNSALDQQRQANQSVQDAQQKVTDALDAQSKSVLTLTQAYKDLKDKLNLFSEKSSNGQQAQEMAALVARLQQEVSTDPSLAASLGPTIALLQAAQGNTGHGGAALGPVGSPFPSSYTPPVPANTGTGPRLVPNSKGGPLIQMGPGSTVTFGHDNAIASLDWWSKTAHDSVVLSGAGR